jgi:hypothetical protein
VRSSYHAEKQARTVDAGGVGEISDILEADIAAPAEVLNAPVAGTVEHGGNAASGAAAGASEGGLVQLTTRRAAS